MPANDATCSSERRWSHPLQQRAAMATIATDNTLLGYSSYYTSCSSARHHLQQRTKPNCSSDHCCPQKRATMAIVATDSTYGTSDDPQWTMPAAVGHGTCNTSNNTDSNYTPLGYSGDDIICSSDDVLLRCNAQQQQYTCIWGHLFLHVVGDTTGTFMVEHERGR